MKFCSLNGGEDGEHTSIGFVEMSKSLVLQGDSFPLEHYLTQFSTHLHDRKRVAVMCISKARPTINVSVITKRSGTILFSMQSHLASLVSSC